MTELKFRAIIPEKNAVIIFTLQDLLENKFSNREILWPWLKAGNIPDQYLGLTDNNGKEIFENDVFKSRNGWIECVNSIHTDWMILGYVSKVAKKVRVITNTHKNPNWRELVK